MQPKKCGDNNPHQARKNKWIVRVVATSTCLLKAKGSRKDPNTAHDLHVTLHPKECSRTVRVPGYHHQEDGILLATVYEYRTASVVSRTVSGYSYSYRHWNIYFRKTQLNSSNETRDKKLYVTISYAMLCVSVISPILILTKIRG